MKKLTMLIVFLLMILLCVTACVGDVPEVSSTETLTTSTSTTGESTTSTSTTDASTTDASTTDASTTKAPTTKGSTTKAPTTKAPTTKGSTTKASTTKAPTTSTPTTSKPTTITPAPDVPYTAWKSTPGNEVCDILMIGNSFCQNYSDELYDMAKAAGIKCRITSVVYGACTLEMHWDFYSNNKSNYQVITYDENGRVTQNGKTLSYALGLADWDVISYQDGEHYYRIEGAESAKKHMEPALTNLVGAIREQFPDATHYFHQVWAYQVGYYRPQKSEFKVSNSTVQATMHNDLREMALEACEKHDLFRVPTGDAWANARADKRIGDVLCTSDKEHDSEQTGGQYLNACVWFETLFGYSCVDNFIDSFYLSESKMTALQEMAHKAVEAACGTAHASTVPTLTFTNDDPFYVEICDTSHYESYKYDKYTYVHEKWNCTAGYYTDFDAKAGQEVVVKEIRGIANGTYKIELIGRYGDDRPTVQIAFGGVDIGPNINMKETTGSEDVSATIGIKQRSWTLTESFEITDSTPRTWTIKLVTDGHLPIFGLKFTPVVE